MGTSFAIPRFLADCRERTDSSTVQLIAPQSAHHFEIERLIDMADVFRIESNP